MSSSITARDRVWAAIVDQQNTTFKVADVARQIRRQDGVEYGDEPSDETIRRVLRSATELGILKHTSGSQYYKKKAKHRSTFPTR